MRDVIREARPTCVLVQGDTTTVFAAALAAFYEQRAGRPRRGGPAHRRPARALPRGGQPPPWCRASPRCTSRPPNGRAQNLLREGIPDAAIHVTGNTVIDALLMVRDKVLAADPSRWRAQFGADLHRRITDPARRMILVTGHRRENFGQGFVDLCTAIRDLARAHPDWDFVYPVHLNPNVQRAGARDPGRAAQRGV